MRIQNTFHISPIFTPLYARSFSSGNQGPDAEAEREHRRRMDDLRRREVIYKSLII